MFKKLQMCDHICQAPKRTKKSDSFKSLMQPHDSFVPCYYLIGFTADKIIYKIIKDTVMSACNVFIMDKTV